MDLAVLFRYMFSLLMVWHLTVASGRGQSTPVIAPDVYISNHDITYETVCFPQQVRFKANFDRLYPNVHWSVNNNAATITPVEGDKSQAILTWNSYPSGTVQVTVHGDDGEFTFPGEEDPGTGGTIDRGFFNGDAVLSFMAGPQVISDARCATEVRPLVLKATGGTEGSYRWYTSLSSASPITGVTGSTYTTSVTGTTTYYVSVNNNLGCESTRVPVQAIVNTNVLLYETFEDVVYSNYLQHFSTDYSYHAQGGQSTIRFKENPCTTDALNKKFLHVDAADVSNESAAIAKRPWKIKVSVVKGTQYKFSAYFKNMNTFSGDNDIGHVYLLINGAFVKDGGWLYKTALCTWKLVEYTYTATATGEIEIASTMYPSRGYGYDYGINNIKFEALKPAKPNLKVNGSVVSQPTYVCSNSPVTLEASGSSTQIYQWYKKVGQEWVVLPGQQGSSLYLPVVSQNESYAVVSDGGNCAYSDKAEINLVLQPVELNELSIQNALGRVPKEEVTGYFLVRAKDQVFLGGESETGYTYTCNWVDDQINQETTLSDLSHSFDTPGIYTVVVTATTPLSCTITKTLTVKVYGVLWEMDMPVAQMGAKRDVLTGAYVLQHCDTDYLMDCFSASGQSLAGAVSSSFVAYGNATVYSADIAVTNPYQQGLSRFKPLATYQYNTPEVSDGTNYEAGKFTVGSLFNWHIQGTAEHPNWLAQSMVSQVSRDGEVLEEENQLQIKSSARFGYHGALPYVVSRNAAHDAVSFESFEVTYAADASSSTFEERFQVGGTVGLLSSTEAHSGSQSLKLQTGSVSTHLPLHPVTYQKGEADRGILVYVWSKVENNGTGKAMSLASLPANLFQVRMQDESGNAVSFTQENTVAVEELSMNPIAQTGEWILYQAHLNPLLAIGKTKLTPVVICTSTEQVWVDDVRVQPADAQVTTYVYDVQNLQLLTSFDDQHFGLYYQYNPEGKLIRKQIETSRGLKTVQETHYNMPKESL